MKKYILITLLVVVAATIVVKIQSKHNTEPLPRNSIQENTQNIAINDLQDGLYRSSPNTFINWTGKTLTKSQQGTLLVDTSSLEINEGGVSGTINLDLNSINANAGQGLTDHLKNEDFFDVQNYPTATFEVNNYVNNELQGDLTIKGISHPVSLPITLNQQDGRINLVGQVDLDRTLWGIEYQSNSIFSDLGDRAINDVIELSIEFDMSIDNE